MNYETDWLDLVLPLAEQVKQEQATLSQDEINRILEEEMESL